MLNTLFDDLADLAERTNEKILYKAKINNKIAELSKIVKQVEDDIKNLKLRKDAINMLINNIKKRG